ncbi:MAG: chemotaxis protein CheW [Candidatus Desulfobacillus denitrificans]|nr:chemotaxis protein CheW [Rhodocyclaceae bacterium]
MGALIKAGQPLPAERQAASEQQQYLTFVLGGEMFAIGILCVKEIIEYGHLTVVPMMPDCIRGVINLRGAVVPVVDLACRFGRRSTELTRRTCIVIVEIEAEGERQDIGVIVDAVSEVLEIQDGQIEPPPAFGARIRTDFIHGMGKVEGKFVIILNVNKVLSLDDLALLGQMAGQESMDALTAAA